MIGKKCLLASAAVLFAATLCAGRDRAETVVDINGKYQLVGGPDRGKLVEITALFLKGGNPKVRRMLGSPRDPGTKSPHKSRPFSLSPQRTGSPTRVPRLQDNLSNLYEGYLVGTDPSKIVQISEAWLGKKVSD